jgi:P63C domain
MNKKIRRVKYKGELDLAGRKLPCCVLEDGTRIFTGRGYAKVLKIVDENDKKASGKRLGRYLGQKSLEPFIYKGKSHGHYDPIICYDGNQKINGYEATLLADFCDGMLEARKHIELDTRQKIIADECEMLVRAFAKVGIIALVDEATGYQYEREKFELQKIVKLFILKGGIFLKWRETFSLDYYKELFGVYDIPFTAENIKKKPRFIGWLTTELVYKNLPNGKEILKKIKERTPKTPKGYYSKKFWQSLTKRVGREALIDVIATVRTLAKISKKEKGKRNKFRRLVKEVYHSNGDLPYIDVEAMDNKKETKFDKVLSALTKVSSVKK